MAMSAADWFVIAGGIAAIAWVNWYFFLAQRTAVAASSEVTITVKGGYDPAVIRVKSGEPVIHIIENRQQWSTE